MSSETQTTTTHDELAYYSDYVPWYKKYHGIPDVLQNPRFGVHMFYYSIVTGNVVKKVETVVYAQGQECPYPITPALYRARNNVFSLAYHLVSSNLDEHGTMRRIVDHLERIGCVVPLDEQKLQVLYIECDESVSNVYEEAQKAMGYFYAKKTDQILKHILHDAGVVAYIVRLLRDAYFEYT